MPRKRLSIRNKRKILRLKYSCGCSIRKISNSCGMGRSTVSDYLHRAKAEAGVLLVQRWILAKLRNHKLLSLADLNCEIKKLLQIMNEKPFHKLTLRTCLLEKSYCSS